MDKLYGRQSLRRRHDSDDQQGNLSMLKRTFGEAIGLQEDQRKQFESQLRIQCDLKPADFINKKLILGQTDDPSFAVDPLVAQKLQQLYKQQRQPTTYRGQLKQKVTAKLQNESNQREWQTTRPQIQVKESRQPKHNAKAFQDPMRLFTKNKQSAKDVGQTHKRHIGRGNRYGILPGRMWDGVERGNGVERQMLAESVNKVRKHQEAGADYLRSL